MTKLLQHLSDEGVELEGFGLAIVHTRDALGASTSTVMGGSGPTLAGALFGMAIDASNWGKRDAGERFGPDREPQ